MARDAATMTVSSEKAPCSKNQWDTVRQHPQRQS